MPFPPPDPTTLTTDVSSLESTEVLIPEPGGFAALALFSVIRRYPTVALFVLDGLANGIDFAFHFWMGRTLLPSDFAVLQTINSMVLIYVTASSVFQPVVGRFVAEARARGQQATIPAVFQTFMRVAVWLGTGFMILLVFLSDHLAGWLNLPAWSIQISGLLIFLSTLRPVAMGVLQGQERFIPFGFSRLVTALARLILAAALVYYGLMLKGALIAFPLGILAGVIAALLFIGKSCRAGAAQPPAGLLRKGWELSFHALIAYIAFMSLTSLDLIWVNRTLPAGHAGAYASLSLMRRVVALLPGVAVVVMFPRVARTLSAGRRPDRLLIHTAGIVAAACGVLTLIYFFYGDEVIRFLFGEAYRAAAPLLGWLGLATTGISLSSIWLNYYLADRPRGYVWLLCAGVMLEWSLLATFPPGLEQAVLAFGITGWFLAIAGLALYLLKVRPSLQSPQ